MSNRVLGALALVAFFLILYGFRGGVPSLFEEDEARISEVAREVVVTGKWIDVQHNFHPWFHKPPLFPWLTAAGFKILGVSEGAARIWSVGFSVGTVLVIYLLATTMFSWSVGTLAAWMAGSSLLFVIYGRMAFVDSALVFFISVTMAAFWGLINRRIHPAFGWSLVGSGIGLSIMTKGPLGIILPVLALGLYMIWDRQWAILVRHKRWIGFGALLLLAIGLPWWVLETLHYGKAFLASMFGDYLYGIYISTFQKHSGPLHFYVWVVLIGFLPWSAFLIDEIVHLCRNRHWTSQTKFLITWIAVVFLVFSFAKTKVPGYILPLFPPLAMMAALAWQRRWEGAKPIIWGLVGTAALHGLVLFVLTKVQVPLAYQGLVIPVFSLLGGLFGVALGAALVSIFWRSRVVFGFLLGYSVIFVGTASLWVLPVFENLRPAKAIVKTLHQMPSRQIYRFDTWYLSSLLFYTQKPMTLLTSLDQVQPVLRQKTPVAVFVSPETATKLAPSDGRIVSKKFDLAVIVNP